MKLTIEFDQESYDKLSDFGLLHGEIKELVSEFVQSNDDYIDEYIEDNSENEE